MLTLLVNSIEYPRFLDFFSVTDPEARSIVCRVRIAFYADAMQLNWGKPEVSPAVQSAVHNAPKHLHENNFLQESENA